MSATGVHVQESQDERRNRRASWPVRRFRLGEEPGEDLSSTTSAEERLAMMWPLALEAFSVSNPVGDRVSRDLWPVRIRVLGQPHLD
jgi:hypothetical protein